MKQHTTASTHTVPCPSCNARVEWSVAARWRPFCSERCHLIDLGNWLSETNRIPGEDNPPESNESGF
jgi:hypothetical protein